MGLERHTLSTVLPLPSRSTKPRAPMAEFSLQSCSSWSLSHCPETWGAQFWGVRSPCAKDRHWRSQGFELVNPVSATLKLLRSCPPVKGPRLLTVWVHNPGNRRPSFCWLLLHRGVTPQERSPNIYLREVLENLTFAHLCLRVSETQLWFRLLPPNTSTLSKTAS